METVWIIVLGLGAVMVLAALGKFVMGLRPQMSLDGVPTTPIERLAWIGVASSGSVGIALGVLVALNGATGLQDDGVVRGVFTTFLLAGVGVWLVAWHRTNRSTGGPIVDERDRAVLARSFSVESVLVLLSLVAWTVVLTELFWDEGSVPVAYLQLIFWSTFLLGIFGRSVGIILGYRQEGEPGA